MITELLNYVIIRKIGEGGMGQVFLAKNKSINQFVAIKMLHPHLSENPVLRDRFLQEAKVLSPLDHPNIVKFLNFVENEHGIFIIMEYVDGVTLEDYINKKTGLIVENRAYPMMEQILNAFTYAHEHGVIHRDIKPSNILVNKEEKIKILDFGIAQIISDASEKQTDISGSLEYMSPEQIQGKPADTRSDIYSLGILFHQMLTGRPPYDTTVLSTLDIRNMIVNHPLERMKKIYPYISTEIQELVDKATSKKLEERFQDCRNMKMQLLKVRQATNSKRGNKKRHTRNGLWIGLVSGLLLLLILGAGYWMFWRNTTRDYVDYKESWLEPEGIGNISKVDESSNAFYRISYRNGKPVKIMRMNSSEDFTTSYDSVFSLYKPAITELFYNDDGKISNKKIYDRHGRLLYTAIFDDDLCEAVVQRNDSSTTIQKFKLNYDNKTGQLKTMHFIDDSGNISTDNKGVAGHKYSYDKSGRLERVTFIDAEDNTVADATGTSILDFDYIDGSHNVKTNFFDNKGRPVVKKEKSESEPITSPSKGKHRKSSRHRHSKH